MANSQKFPYKRPLCCEILRTLVFEIGSERQRTKVPAGPEMQPTMKNNDTTRRWWKEAVVYQIYPRSFSDSNGDGVGDLPGITARLDYVQSLGVDVIWLNPIFASPNADNGYDISDYRAIMAEFGCMEDFDRLLREVHARGMRLILDLVANHTSSQHPWFLEARRSRENSYYDYYLWWPEEKGTPPLRRSHFDEEGNAWRYNPATRSWYLHYFAAEQPDLNWENPQVRREIHEAMRFWFERGIDGFRLDSIPYISKDITFPEIDTERYPDIFSAYNRGPRLHEFLHEIHREVFARYDSLSVGEGSEIAAEQLGDFISPEREELNLLYHFDAATVRNHSLPDAPDTGIGYSLVELKRMFARWDRAAGDGWPAIYLGNHDQPRMVSRFGSNAPEWREASARMLALFLLTMRGTPFWYAGDELGMTNIRFTSIEDYDDLDTRNHYFQIEREGGDTAAYLREQQEIGRDNARTPFQWDTMPHAGFTTGRPWLRVHPNYVAVNATAEAADPTSPLSFFRRAVTLRRATPDLVYAGFELLDEENPRTFTYLRRGAEADYLIALNFSPQSAEAHTGLDLAHAEALLHSDPDRSAAPFGPTIPLRPYEGVLLRLPKCSR